MKPDRAGRLGTGAMLAGFMLAAGTIPSWGEGEVIQELTAQGLLFAPAASVAVEPRSVSVGLDSMTLTYGLTDATASPVDITLTLKLPTLDLSDPDASFALPADDPVNFMGASVTVDGAPAPLTFRQTAEIDGRDITRQLKDAKLPLLPGATLKKQLSTVAPEALLHIVADGLIKPNGTAQDGTQNFVPAWSVKTSGSRKQRLEPGRAVTVEARLKTSLGAAQDTLLRKAVRQGDGMGDRVAALRKTYCIDDAMIGGVDKLAGGAAENTASLGEKRLALRLPPAAGNVPAYKIAIDKGAADSLVSTCLTGLRKTGPTTFERDGGSPQPLPAVLRILVVGKF